MRIPYLVKKKKIEIVASSLAYGQAKPLLTNPSIPKEAPTGSEGGWSVLWPEKQKRQATTQHPTARTVDSAPRIDTTIVITVLGSTAAGRIGPSLLLS